MKNVLILCMFLFCFIIAQVKNTLFVSKSVREAANKKVHFMLPLPPPPLELSGQIFGGDFFLERQISSFFLVARPLPPPLILRLPLVARGKIVSLKFHFF